MQLKTAKIHFFHLGRLTSELRIPLIIDLATPNCSQLYPHYLALTTKNVSQIGQELRGAPSHATEKGQNPLFSPPEVNVGALHSSND